MPRKIVYSLCIMKHFLYLFLSIVIFSLKSFAFYVDIRINLSNPRIIDAPASDPSVVNGLSQINQDKEIEIVSDLFVRYLESDLVTITNSYAPTGFNGDFYIPVEDEARISLNTIETYGEIRIKTISDDSYEIWGGFNATMLQDYFVPIVFSNGDVNLASYPTMVVSLGGYESFSLGGDGLLVFDYDFNPDDEATRSLLLIDSGSSYTINSINSPLVPEPSTYALILGATAFGFAIISRLKSC